MLIFCILLIVYNSLEVLFSILIYWKGKMPGLIITVPITGFF